MTPKKHEFEHDVKLDVEARVRQGVKAVLEEVLEEEMAEHLEAGYRELTPTRREERNGHYQRNLLTPAGKIERLEVPRDREGEFVTELFERNVLSSVPATSLNEVAEDIKAIFKVRRRKTALALAEEFVELYGKRFPKAVAVFEAGIEDALTYLSYPGSHHARIRTTNMLERLFKEVKRRTRVVGVFPNETSAATLATEIALRSSEEWAQALPYDGRPRSSGETKPTTFQTLTRELPRTPSRNCLKRGAGNTPSVELGGIW